MKTTFRKLKLGKTSSSRPKKMIKTLSMLLTTTLSNTRLAALLQLTKHVFGINGFPRRSSVRLSELKVMFA